MPVITPFFVFATPVSAVPAHPRLALAAPCVAMHGLAAECAKMVQELHSHPQQQISGIHERSVMKAIWNGAVIAQSDDTVVIEGNHYFPESALNRDYVTFSNHHTMCAWKGQASYYSLLVDGEMNTDAAWYYPDPKPEAEEIKGRVAFWKGVKVEA
jgi:uncharacterized protein (DUF427 family)